MVVVVTQVVILVLGQVGRRARITPDQLLLHRHEASHIVLHLLKEPCRLFHEDGELVDLGGEDSLLCLVARVDVDFESRVQPFEQLARGHLDEALEASLDVETLGSSEDLELFAVDDEVVLGEFPEEALQVEAPLLQEDDVLVAHSLLRRDLGQQDSRPALLEAVLEKVELIVAPFALELALHVLSFHHVNDVTMEVLRVTD